jgi:hypothetical protein
LCNAGLYAVFRDVSAGTFSECRLCPEGVDCPALRNMTISSRYYALRDAVTLEVLTFLCDGDRCAADGACGPNRLPASNNPLCGQCLPGHSEWAGACVPCAGPNGGLVFGLLLLAWACVLAIHVFSQSASSSSALRITMFFWQVSFLIVGGAAWLRWAAFLDLNFLTAAGGGGGAGGFAFSFQGGQTHLDPARPLGARVEEEEAPKSRLSVRQRVFRIPPRPAGRTVRRVAARFFCSMMSPYCKYDGGSVCRVRGAPRRELMWLRMRVPHKIVPVPQRSSAALTRTPARHRCESWRRSGA